jgi:hypothetical protein
MHPVLVLGSKIGGGILLFIIIIVVSKEGGWPSYPTTRKAIEDFVLMVVMIFVVSIFIASIILPPHTPFPRPANPSKVTLGGILNC